VAGGRAFPGDPTAARRLLLEVADEAELDLVQARAIEMIHHGHRHFDRVVHAVGAAEREICLEMYQIRRDPVGWKVCAALAEAAGRGVKVRLLLDSFGSSAIARWVPILEGVGAEVRWYSPWRLWNNPFRRTHRKLVVIDGRLASVGGINLAEEFSEVFNGDSAWRDVALWLEGPAAWALRKQFDAAWLANGGGHGSTLDVPLGSGELCALAGPRGTRGRPAAAYLALAEAARRELVLATPYFLPDRALRARLRAAARRGVRVLVVVPRANDIWWFKHGARTCFAELLEAGVSVWERFDRMVHAKVAVADRMVAAVGSTNLNRLSFHHNSETLLLTTNHTVVDEVRSLIVDEAGDSSEALTPEEWPSHPDRRRVAELVAGPLASLL
jgi:cardiolipin synthase